MSLQKLTNNPSPEAYTAGKLKLICRNKCNILAEHCLNTDAKTYIYSSVATARGSGLENRRNEVWDNISVFSQTQAKVLVAIFVENRRSPTRLCSARMLFPGLILR